MRIRLSINGIAAKRLIQYGHVRRMQLQLPSQTQLRSPAAHRRRGQHDKSGFMRYEMRSLSEEDVHNHEIWKRLEEKTLEKERAGKGKGYSYPVSISFFNICIFPSTHLPAVFCLNYTSYDLRRFHIWPQLLFCSICIKISLTLMFSEYC